MSYLKQMNMKSYYYLSLMLCALSAGVSAQEITKSTDVESERTLSADSIITQDKQLDSLYQSLPEVMITGQRPIVKAEQGKLVYDLPRLIGNLPVDNAYDAVKELPGVTEMNGGLMLAGQGVTVILDGKVSTMSTEQLYSLLKSIPSSRIEKAEVMYNAPARYQVRGALINITLKQSTGGPSSWQGELYGKYNQKHYEGFNERASLIYNGNKFSADFLYSHNHGRGYSLTDKEAISAGWAISTDESDRTTKNEPFAVLSEEISVNADGTTLIDALLFPQDLTIEYYFEVTYSSASDREPCTSTVPLVSLPLTTWEAGKHYRYTFTVSDEDRILFDTPTVNAWGEATGGIIIVE